MRLKKNLLKTALSILLLIVIFNFVNLHEIIDVISHAKWWAIAIVIIGYFCGQLLSTYKWLLIARNAKIEATFMQAFKAYFTGMFANFFGLGVVGGDLTRALLLSGGKNPKSVCFASVIADRLHGLTILATIGLVCSIIFGSQTVHENIMLLVFASEFLIILGWFFGPWILRRLPIQGKPKAIAHQVADVFPQEPKALLKISLVSAVFHALQISLHGLMAYAISASVPLSVLFVLIPFVNILATLPISWNGLGVRESGYLFFLTPIFLEKPEAVAFGTIWIFAVTLNSLLGGLIAFFYGTNKLIKEE